MTMDEEFHFRFCRNIQSLDERFSASIVINQVFSEEYAQAYAASRRRIRFQSLL